MPEYRTEEILNLINLKHGTQYVLQSRFEKGENGAYSIAEPQRVSRVLKYSLSIKETNLFDTNPSLPKIITDHLRTLDYPIPKFLQVGTFDNSGMYWIQEKLLGKPLSQAPDTDVLKELLTLIDLQINQAVSSKQNWSAYINDVVFGDSMGWIAKLNTFSTETTAFTDTIRQVLKAPRRLNLPANDIVHGDMSYEQVMLHKGKISGIIDWQEAGCGDVVFDISRLLYRLHDRPHLASIILEKLRGQDPHKVMLYTIFTALEFIAWRIDSNPNLDKSINKATSAINYIQSNLS